MTRTGAKKHLGQHFLQDEYVLSQFVAALAPKPTQRLVEIGPGLGALTLPVLQRCQQLDVIELDRDVLDRLRAHCSGHGDLRIHQADVLQFDFDRLTDQPATLRLIGNLPYNISSAILFRLIEYFPLIADLQFMFQSEVADRLTAEPNTPDYGRLSVMIQYYFEVATLFHVSPQAFIPIPKVDSAVVRLVPRRPLAFAAQNEKRFGEIVRRAFGQRRKTLRNALRDIVGESEFSGAQIDPSRRGETLSVEEFVRLANQT